MQVNDGQDIPAGAPALAETALEKFEREQLSRRQALKRFGMTSAMATFALFNVDDLARMVGKAMQQRAGDNKVVEQVAKEFQQAGIALAAYDPCAVVDPPSATEIGKNCASKPTYYGGGTTTCEECVAKGCGDNYPSPQQSGGTQVHNCTVTAQEKCTTVTDK